MKWVALDGFEILYNPNQSGIPGFSRQEKSPPTPPVFPGTLEAVSSLTFDKPEQNSPVFVYTFCQKPKAVRGRLRREFGKQEQLPVGSASLCSQTAPSVTAQQQPIKHSNNAFSWAAAQHSTGGATERAGVTAPAGLNIKILLNIKTKLLKDKSQAKVTTHSNILPSSVSKHFVTEMAWALGKNQRIRTALNYSIKPSGSC